MRLRKKMFFHSKTEADWKRAAILTTGIFFAGLILGALGVRRDATDAAFLPLFAKNLIELRQSSNFWMVTGGVFLSALLFLAASLFSGASPFGTPVLMLLPLARGIGIGCVSAYLTLHAGVRGIFAELLIFFLPDALLALIFILYNAQAACVSIQLFQIHIAHKSGIAAKLDEMIRLFLLSGIASLSFSLAAGLLNHLFLPVLSAAFSML